MRLIRETRRIEVPWGSMKLLVFRPAAAGKYPGILWIHGGGFSAGGAWMAHFSQGLKAAKKFGAVLVSPEYRLSKTAPYPAALEDCWEALNWLDDHRDELGVGRLMVGGESAGGNLAAAVCIRARDTGTVDIAYQTPVYPMLDCFDTGSNSNVKHLLYWDTRRNRRAWKRYLGNLYGSEFVPALASPARERSLEGLPPFYSFVGEGEPFYTETLDYAGRLSEAGVEAAVDVYPEKRHGFDMLMPLNPTSRRATKAFQEQFKKHML